MKIKWKHASFGKIIAMVLLIFWAILSLFPMYWMFQTSLTPKEEIGTFPPKWFPSRLTMENYASLFEGFSWSEIFHGKGIMRWTVNSIILCVTVTFTVVLFSSMAGYGFAKKEFPGKNIMFWMIIATMMIPAQVTLVPVYLMLTKIGLKGSLLAVIIPASASVFGVFMMRQFLINLSSDFMDAARIDGCTEWGIFWRIVLPLTKPAIATLAIFTFIGEWNSYLWPLIVLDDPATYPLTLGLATMQRQNINSYGLQAAGSAISAIPMLIVFFSFQKYFMKGLTLGGNKG